MRLLDKLLAPELLANTDRRFDWLRSQLDACS